MASPSSTSSSEPARAGRPWALVLALLVVAGVEVGFRLVDPRRMIGYELGVQEYHAAKLWAERVGVPEVVVIGSSRAREAIDAPLLASLLPTAPGESPAVGNFACAGGTAEETEAVLAHLLRQPKRPRVVIYGVTQRQLWGEKLEFSRAAIFWRLENWWAARREYGGQVDASLPVVLRAEFERLFSVFACRQKVRQALADLFSGQTRLGHSLSGGATEWQERHPRLSMIGEQVDDRRVSWYVGRLLRGGRYPLGQEKLQAFRRLLGRARAAGVALVVVQLPQPRILLRHLPAGVVEEALARMEGACREAGVRFVRLEELGLEFSDEDFLDQSHLNRQGATLFTRALVEKVLLLHFH